MKKLLLLCLLLIATLHAVADVRVCDESAYANGHFNSSFIKSGSITWDKNSHTLTMDNAVVEYTTDNVYDNIRPIRITENEATIVIHGQCKLTTNGFVAIALDSYNNKNVTIQGDGNLQTASTWIDIFLIDTYLTIKDITLECERGIANNGNGVNIALAFDNVQANIKGRVERIGNGISFRNCSITYPADAYVAESEGYGYAIYYGNQNIPEKIIISRNGGLKGDVNNDGEINIADINAVIDMILSGNSDMRGDVNGDNEVNIADINALIDLILGGGTPQNNHEYVDLGLPSGTLWATMNIGANSPEQYGDYFAWGETAPKELYTWDTYKWCNGHQFSMTKYCRESENGYEGFTDGKDELDTEDDAAYVNWGSSWRMPSLEQQQELVNECTWEWTTRNGVDGYLGIGPNGKTIFLPATGVRYGTTVNGVGIFGRFLSRNLHDEFSFHAFFMYFNSGSIWSGGYDYRYDGHTVRAVRISHN